MIHLSWSAPRLAQLMEHQSAEREVLSLNPSRTNMQGLKITKDAGAAFAMASVNG